MYLIGSGYSLDKRYFLLGSLLFGFSLPDIATYISILATEFEIGPVIDKSYVLTEIITLRLELLDLNCVVCLRTVLVALSHSKEQQHKLISRVDYSCKRYITCECNCYGNS